MGSTQRGTISIEVPGPTCGGMSASSTRGLDVISGTIIVAAFAVDTRLDIITAATGTILVMTGGARVIAAK